MANMTKFFLKNFDRKHKVSAQKVVRQIFNPLALPRHLKLLDLTRTLSLKADLWYECLGMLAYNNFVLILKFRQV